MVFATKWRVKPIISVDNLEKQKKPLPIDLHGKRCQCLYLGYFTNIFLDRFLSLWVISTRVTHAAVASDAIFAQPLPVTERPFSL